MDATVSAIPITTQPQVAGEPGVPLAVVMAEAVYAAGGTGFFVGLSQLLRGERAAASEIRAKAFAQLMADLSAQASALGADAVVSVTFERTHLTRGNGAAVRHRISAFGTAVTLG